jgi:hypothetical protein
MADRDFSQQMQRLNDATLVEIVTYGETDGYLAAAVTAARNELMARDAGPWAIAAIADHLRTKRSQEAELASRPLSLPARIAFFVSPIGFFPILFAAALEVKGYTRKSSEAWS